MAAKIGASGSKSTQIMLLDLLHELVTIDLGLFALFAMVLLGHRPRTIDRAAEPALRRLVIRSYNHPLDFLVASFWKPDLSMRPADISYWLFAGVAIRAPNIGLLPPRPTPRSGPAEQFPTP